jgi:hypothetical protein
MLRVGRDLSLSSFEKHLSALSGHSAIELQLPNSLDQTLIGGTAAAIQLVVTWARRFHEGRLVLHSEKPADATLENFAKTPLGIVALNMAYAIRTKTHLPVSRREAMELARPFVEAMHSGPLRGIARGPSIPLICLDNAQYLGKPSALYDPNGEVQVPYAFENLANALWENIVPDVRFANKSREILPDLGVLLHELFLNTHDHACTDLNGDKYRRSTRGIITRYHYIRPDTFDDLSLGHVPIAQYLRAWHPDFPEARHAQFVEVSVFDSGPGLAAVWLVRRQKYTPAKAAAVSIQEEYEAVSSCLQKGQTSKENRLRGNGLYRVLRILKQHAGLMRLRTGRLSLVCGFPGQTAQEPLELNGAQMVDAITGKPPKEDRARAEGAVLTILIPLNAKVAQ